jgi:hypothetical protein
MKYINKSHKKAVLALLLVALHFTACNKDFLDRKPQGDADVANFFLDGNQATQATNAVYNQLRSWECTALPYLGTTDILSDDADKGSTPTDALYMLDMDNFTFDPANSSISGVWSGFYRVIARANLAIQRIPNVPAMDETLRKRLLGENKALRAYAYLLLVQWFGEIPIITEPLSADQYYTQTRKPVAEVYEQIERDLTDAIAVLPLKSKYPSADLGRLTKGAAQGILAKLYMVKHDFPKAETLCLDIINSNEYSLLPVYRDIFLPTGENGAESVFEIQAAALDPVDGITGPGATPFNMVQGVRGIPNLGWGFNRPSDNLVSSFELFDPRKSATYLEPGNDLPDGSAQIQDNPEIIGERFNRKAWVPAHTGLQDNGPGNIRILRYADILLLAAEALNENGKSSQALVFLNQVRQRARATAPAFPPGILADITITDQTQLREKIYRERRSELAMEQHRWFDLQRWGRQSAAMIAAGKNFVANKHELLPVPQKEIDLSDMVQNAGY